MNGGHFVIKCKECGAVIAQCRCPDPNKPVKYEVCEKCKQGVKQPKSNLEKAMDYLTEKLKSSEDYYYGWQSNIAMAFFDEARRQYPESICFIQDETLHKIANDAAKNFLNNLIK